MGYFSQRKKQERENLFMLISISALTIIYLCLILSKESNGIIGFFRAYQFHIYLYNLFLLLYTLFHKKFIYILLSVVLLVVNYGSLAKTTRLFFSDSIVTEGSLHLQYQKGEQKYVSLLEESQKIKHEGKLDLSPHLTASFIKFDKNNQEYTLITLDFLEKYKKEYVTAYKNLEKFILMQNGPVIVIGDFGIPSWHPLFADFLIATDLSVKNRVLFTNGKQNFRFWQIPSINILGFDNISLKEIDQAKERLNIILGF